MRQMACVLLAVVSGCAAMGDEARLKHRAESVVWSALAAPASALRLQAARIAADVADPLLDRGLLARLDDASPTVRATAAAALARTTPPALEVLRALLDGADAAARVVAIDAIGALPDGRERLSRLAADPDLRVRARAATAIAQWKPAGARALLNTLLHDADAGVRGQALAAVATLGDRGVLGEVVQALDDPALGVRLAALGALVRLGRDAVGDRLLALGVGSDKYVALRAAVQLSHAGRATAALAAVRAAADGGDAALRVAAMNAAGELGTSGAALALAHLGDGDLDVRLAAARAVVAVGRHDAALPVLVSALSTSRRLDAADELARLGDRRGFEVLQAAARSSDVGERRAAVALLAPLPSAKPSLVAALDDSDGSVRLEAAGELLQRFFRAQN
jgi:HEAT repeat protein